MIKIDPYLNVDAGTMSPFEHGETFVLDDGGETDLDLGNYERFLDISLSFPPPSPRLCALVPRPSMESFSDGLWPPTSFPQRALSALMGAHRALGAQNCIEGRVWPITFSTALDARPAKSDSEPPLQRKDSGTHAGARTVARTTTSRQARCTPR